MILGVGYRKKKISHQQAFLYNLTNWLINMARPTEREELRRLRDELRQQRIKLRQEMREQRTQLRQRGHELRRMGSRGQPEESRASILRAAAREFAEYGIDGARTDAIAREAKVNKALLYYYFKDKETLYGAVLDDVFSGLKATVFRVLESDLAPREKIMAYAGSYFDFVASNQTYPRLMQREMMRAKEGSSPHLERIVKNYFQPIFLGVSELLKKGIAESEFRPVDPVHFIPSMISMIVFYFSGSPVMRKLFGFNPLAPERIAERRAAVLDFISAALFLSKGPKGQATQGARS
jgi:TetR/AcrR family transcriptional regulator